MDGRNRQSVDSRNGAGRALQAAGHLLVPNACPHREASRNGRGGMRLSETRLDFLASRPPEAGTQHGSLAVGLT
jgi:hypothetical protein